MFTVLQVIKPTLVTSYLCVLTCAKNNRAHSGCGCNIDIHNSDAGLAFPSVCTSSSIRLDQQSGGDLKSDILFKEDNLTP